MQKAYDPQSFETRIYSWWSDKGCFRAEDESSKPAFSIPMPPPNVTGALHNGHALFVTIQDVLIRWKRMSGFNALWMPGTDHAGIATQMIVERELAKQGVKRHDLGRTEFLRRVWDWKEKHGGIIVGQMKKLGASPDWSRLRFTMDEGLSKAVREVFVKLYEEKLIYRGTRIINWCARCHTALSDLEVIPKERKGHFWHLKYERVDGKGALTIATTRPETLLGDTAVAVHPNDDRYREWIGKKVRLPLVGREIPVVADEHADMAFGSGALKVTPGHDFNDYEIGKRHDLPIVTVFDKAGRVNEEGGKYGGLTIAEAREHVVKDLEEQGLLLRIEDHTHAVGVCQRCETVVEPMVSDQWFMNVKPLAEKAIEAVKKGEKLSLVEIDQRDDAIKILPGTWLATYYQWMENIRDWCISRQLWWGHQIPAWYCDCGEVIVSRTNPTKCTNCGAPAASLRQDEDVLDTWFSSALWPFSTLGWPEKTKAYHTFYPTSIMETGFDILFFWVARMIMMGMHFNSGRVPFKRVYLHAMVRDEKGQKMSKTKGNVIDPLDIIAEYGADAFRFTLAAMAGQGRDVKLSLDRIDGYKAFCNKLWNASRYVLMRLGHVVMEGAPEVPKANFALLTGGQPLDKWVAARRSKLHPINRWILGRLDQAIERVNSGLEEFRLNDAANEIYEFVWREYCDWYIEFSKELLASAGGGHEALVAETQICLMHVLDQALKLAHPFVPFVTEEIYQALPERPGVSAANRGPIMIEAFPETSGYKTSDADEDDEMRIVGMWKESIDRLRAFRGENNISPKARPRATFEVGESRNKTAFEKGVPFIRALAQLEGLDVETGQHFKGQPTTGEILTSAAKFYIPLKGLVDVDGELKRVEKERMQTLGDIDFVKGKLSRESFMAKAPKELVDKEREKLASLEGRSAELDRLIDRLKKLK